MKKDEIVLFKNLIDKYKLNKKWKKIVGVLSCITVFVTMYFLMSPAITQTGTTYTFHLIDSFSGENYTWKQTLGATTSYDLKLHYVDTQGNYIEGSDLTLELADGTDFGNVAYGFGYVPKRDDKVKGLDLIDKFNLKTKTTSNGNKYEFDHVEVLVGTEWKSFYSNMETSEHWALYCYNSSHDNITAEKYTLDNYGWYGNYEVPITSGTVTTYEATKYQVNAETEYKIVYKLVMNGNDTVVPTVGADSGITFKMYDYDGDNSETEVNANGLYKYFTFRGSNKKGTVANEVNSKLDADGFTANRAKVEATLDETGNPVFICGDECKDDANLKNRSLGYLFGNDTNALGTDTQGVHKYNPTNTPLLHLTDSATGIKYYSYSSNDNAVDYDIDNDRFLLRNYRERSYKMTTYKNEPNRYEFLPFNYWDNVTYIGDSSREYQHKYEDVNLWYGMTMEFDFYMPKNGMLTGNNGSTQPMKFEFSGDDDVWVFIDGVLVLDLGGTHGSVDGSIDFSTGQVESKLNWQGSTAYKSSTYIYDAFVKAGKEDTVEWNGKTLKNFEEHTLKFFYLERGGSVANCKIKFNMPVLPPGGLWVQKDYDGDVKFPDEEHEFTLYKVTESGNQTVPNTKYVVNGTAHTTNNDGKFYLKAGQVAVFELANYDKYYVKETTPGTYSISQNCTLNGENCENISQSDIFEIAPDFMHKVVFTNEIKKYNLNVAKIAYDISESEDNLNTDDFGFEVILKNDDGSPVDIKDDTNSKYIVNHETGVVTFTLKSKSDVTIYGIPLGTNVTLREVSHDGYQAIMKKTGEDYVLSNGDTYEFMMDKDKNITVYNIPGVVLPETGGQGIFKYLFVGISLILIAIKFGYSYFFKWKGCDE